MAKFAIFIILPFALLFAYTVQAASTLRHCRGCMHHVEKEEIQTAAIDKIDSSSQRGKEIEERMFGWLPSKAEDEKRKRDAYLEAIGEKNETSQVEQTHYSYAPLRSGTAIIPRFAAMKTKSPWMDGAQSRPGLQPSDAEMKPDVAERDTQQYSNPLKPPEWLTHDHLEPPGLPSTPPPPPPEMPNVV